MSKDIWIANDHGGYSMKLDVMKWLGEKGYSVIDCGCHSDQIVRYPYYAAKVATGVSEGEAWRGILICSTGIGMSIVANKFAGIRASLCADSYTAKMTRMHNDSNIFCIGGKTLGILKVYDMLDVWLNTPYEGGRHNISLDLIRDLDEKHIKNTWTGSDMPEYPY